MKSSYFPFFGLLVAVCAALALTPALAGLAPIFTGLCLLSGAILVVLGWCPCVRSCRTETAAPTVATKPAVAPVPIAPPPPPLPPAARFAPGETELVTLLALFQEKGRLIDFLMDDIAACKDAQLGAAARVVHQGCASVLKAHLTIRPLSEAKEGARITVPAGAPADHYRVIGKVTDPGPLTGVLVHPGWQVEEVKLPRLVNPAVDRLPPLAPAQVEIR